MFRLVEKRCPKHVFHVVTYVENQERHHAKQSFTDEFRKFLDKFGIEYDNQYIFHEVE